METDGIMSGEEKSYSSMSLKDVWKVYQSFGRTVVALKGINFEVPKGKLTCLVGPSGSGKTVIIHMMAGYETPDGGQVLMDDKPVGGPGPERIVVYQETALLPWKTLMENTTFGPLMQKKISKKEAIKRAQALIDKSGLTGFEKKFPYQLSGGMQRRSELIRALINDPKVLLMDEPLRGLDAMTRQIMQDYVIKLYEETKTTMLFITSDIDEAIYLADTVYFLTQSPGFIKDKMEITLPRPRTSEVLITKEYNELLAKAIDIVMAEKEFI